jgi:hypothetical protein
MTALPFVYLVHRHNFNPHYSDEIGREYVHSIRTTKDPSNNKANPLLMAIKRNEDYNTWLKLKENGWINMATTMDV